jgi:DNA repair exonuclease SbcCD nuclease subunit
MSDTHLGFKAYDSNKRSEEALDMFDMAVELLYNDSIRTVFIPGDLTDDTTLPNWLEKRLVATLRRFHDVEFVIDGGNHDSTKTYSSVSQLDVLAELDNVTVINNFKVEYGETNGITWTAVPHMRSQKEFLAAVQSLHQGLRTDVLMIHCMVDSRLDLGPNDLNIDSITLSKLAPCFGNIWVGHQHVPVELAPNMHIPGSMLELNFGELGERNVYTCDGNGVIQTIALPQPRQMIRVDEDWVDLTRLFTILESMFPQAIYKLTLKHVPHEQYSQASAAVENFAATFKGDLVWDLLKTGHIDVEISTIDAHFDLLMEFDQFALDNKVDDPIMRDMLEDAIAAVSSEEEDLLI